MGLALPPEKIISEFQTQNPKLMKPSIINAFLITYLADFIKFTKTKITAKFEFLIITLLNSVYYLIQFIT